MCSATPKSSVLKHAQGGHPPPTSASFPTTKTQITSEVVPKRPMRKSLPKSRTSLQNSNSQRDSICSNEPFVNVTNGLTVNPDQESAVVSAVAAALASADKTADASADASADKSSDDTLTDVKATLEDNHSAETLVEVKMNDVGNVANANAPNADNANAENAEKATENADTKTETDEEDNKGKWSRSKSYVHAIDT